MASVVRRIAVRAAQGAAGAMLGIALLAAHPAMAGSFALPTYSMRDLGMANAGFAALAEDASTVFANPAGLAQLDEPEIVVGAVGQKFITSFDDLSGQNVLGAPLTGIEPETVVPNRVIPNIYAALPVNSWLTLGLGISVPFGIDVDYGEPWIGRFQAVSTKITAIDVNPSVGIRLTDWASIGLGFSAQRASSTITNAIDFGAACTQALQATLPAACGLIGLTPGSFTASQHIEGTDWGFGWNAGLLLSLGDRTRIGLAYRSAIDHELDGQADFSYALSSIPFIGFLLPFLTPVTGTFGDTASQTGLDLPASLTASVHHRATDRWALMASLQWTGWSRFEALRIDFANPLQPDVVETFDYENTIRVALGTSYVLNDWLILRAGLAYDESPSQDVSQSTRIPDSDRYIGAIGFTIQALPDLDVDFAYQFTRFRDFRFNQTGTFGDRITGTYRSSAHNFGVAANWRFWGLLE